MPYRPDGDFLQDDQLSSRWDDEPEERESSGWWKWAVAVASLAIFGGVVWYAYSTGASGPTGPVKTFEADASPYKVRPENPGGEVIPDKDKLVFNEAVGRPEESEDVLGEMPETPQAKPEPIVVRKFTPSAPPKPPAPQVAAAEPAPAEAVIPETAPAQSGEATPQQPAAPAAPVAEAPAAEAPVAPAPLEDRPGQESAPGAAAQPGAQSDLANMTIGETPPWKEGDPVPPATATPAPPKPASGGKSPVVQLGAYASNDAAMQAWSDVSRKFGDAVGGASPQVVKISVPGKGDLYRLVIGPYGSRDQATQVCVQLKSRGRDCIVNAN
ncbi:SPOR domain-containing protein [Iodidimonas sp. SYSU 1G8]|uniref:SPOR domain-containing protein n=1 Tax=Iodidimonas sp. SYSU 1G8 TaxID=3133967 RepID=UPI0031FEAC89